MFSRGSKALYKNLKAISERSAIENTLDGNLTHFENVEQRKNKFNYQKSCMLKETYFVLKKVTIVVYQLAC